MIVSRSLVRLPQLADGVLRQDAVEVLVVVERVRPSSTAGICSCHSRDVLRRLDHLVQVRARAYFTSLTIGNVGRLDLVDLRRVDVDVDDLGVLGELRHLAGHAVVEPHAQASSRSAFVHGVVGVDAAVHAQHVQRERIVAGKSAQAHQGHGDGDARLAHQLAQLLAGVGGDDAAAGIDHRPLAAQLDGRGNWRICSGWACGWSRR